MYPKTYTGSQKKSLKGKIESTGNKNSALILATPGIQKLKMEEKQNLNPDFAKTRGNNKKIDDASEFLLVSSVIEKENQTKE